MTFHQKEMALWIMTGLMATVLLVAILCSGAEAEGTGGKETMTSHGFTRLLPIRYLTSQQRSQRLISQNTSKQIPQNSSLQGHPFYPMGADGVCNDLQLCALYHSPHHHNEEATNLALTSYLVRIEPIP